MTASKRRASGDLGPFEPKLLQLSVVPDSRSGAAKHTGQPVGSVSLNLADFARADGGLQDELVLAGPGGSTLVTPSGPPKLLVTIRCAPACHAQLQAASLDACACAPSASHPALALRRAVLCTGVGMPRGVGQSWLWSHQPQVGSKGAYQHA